MAVKKVAWTELTFQEEKSPNIIIVKIFYTPVRRIKTQPAWQALGSSGQKRERAGEKETLVSPSLAPVLSFAHYFQAPAMQAKF